MATDLSQFTVPNNRFDVAQDNAEKLDSVVNGPNAVVTTRTGKGIQSLDRIIASIAAVTDRGAWTTATNYQVKDLVVDTGTYYIAINAHTSGATFSGDIANWRVYQGVIQSQGDLRYGTIFATAAAMQAANPITPDGESVDLVAGMTVETQERSTGNAGGGKYVIATGDTSDTFGRLLLDNGNTAVLQTSAILDIAQYGAVGDYNPATATGTDNTAPINATLSAAHIGVSSVVGRDGKYLITGDGIDIPDYTTLQSNSSAYSFRFEDDAAWGDDVGFVLVPRSMTRSHSVSSMITQCELSGGVLANPSSAEAYTASSGTKLDNYQLTDFTNEDAVGATAATARLISVAVKMGRGSVIEDVLIRTTKTTGAFVALAGDTDFGEQVDIGILAENALFAKILSCNITWAFRIAGVAHIQASTGDGFTPQGDRLLIKDSMIEGHSGLIVRNADTVNVESLTTTEIRIKFFKSHRFAAASSINVGSINITYTTLTLIGDELVFTGLSADPVAAGIVANDELERGEDAANFGLGGTSLKDSFIRSISHPRGDLSTVNTYTDAFDYSGKNLEFSGANCRGIHISNTYLHGREDVTLFANRCSDIYFVNSYHEAKANNQGASSSRFIGLSRADKVLAGIVSPAGSAENIHFVSWSQSEAQTDMTPTFRTSTTIGRFSTGDGLFSPLGTSNDLGYPYGRGVVASETRKRLPKVTGDIHPLQMFDSVGQSGSIRHSFDNDGRAAFGFGYDATVDLPHRLCMFGGAGDRILAENAGGTGTVGFIAENTAGSAELIVNTAGDGVLRSGGVDRLFYNVTEFSPSVDNQRDLGSASFRWEEVFSAIGSINTSDAREKTPVRSLSAVEIQAAKALAAETGAYKWLASIEEKGADAREHIGMTVQRAIEILESFGLEPFRYGFICYDEWDAVEAVHEDEELISEYRPAGNRFSFRPDQLDRFIARGLLEAVTDIEERLTAAGL